jgi:hypothetical protein
MANYKYKCPACGQQELFYQHCLKSGCLTITKDGEEWEPDGEWDLAQVTCGLCDHQDEQEEFEP